MIWKDWDDLLTSKIYVIQADRQMIFEIGEGQRNEAKQGSYCGDGRAGLIALYLTGAG